MKHTYKISGMTCGSCKTSVEKSLSSIKEVENVVVNLENNEATITMKAHISVEELQNMLAPKYVISEKQKKEKEEFVLDFSEEKTELKQLFPLFLIFGYITVAAILMSINPWNTTDFMFNFMGLFYIVFSFFKLLDVKGFATSFQMYDPLARKFSKYGLVYPFIELMLGIFFLMRFQILTVLVLTLIILGITTIGVVKSLSDKKAIKCACLGTVLDLPMTKATFIENTIMIVMAIIMILSFV